MNSAQANHDPTPIDAAGHGREDRVTQVMSAAEIDRLLDSTADRESIRIVGGITNGVLLGAALWAILLAGIWLLF